MTKAGPDLQVEERNEQLTANRSAERTKLRSQELDRHEFLHTDALRPTSITTHVAPRCYPTPGPATKTMPVALWNERGWVVDFAGKGVESTG